MSTDATDSIMITLEMLEALRRKVDGVIVANNDGTPEVRSKVHYDGPDPLDTGEQIIIIDGDPAWSSEVEATDDDILDDLNQRWTEMVADAREMAW